MRIQTVQIVAGLLAAIAFIIAFISAGVAVISFTFALLGACAVGWLAYTVAKRMLMHRSPTDVTPS
ncbi:hypothetical protein BH10PSE1_BH10PSE1_23770 [soil metagenome]